MEVKRLPANSAYENKNFRICRGQRYASGKKRECTTSSESSRCERQRRGIRKFSGGMSTSMELRMRVSIRMLFTCVRYFRISGPSRLDVENVAREHRWNEPLMQHYVRAFRRGLVLCLFLLNIFFLQPADAGTLWSAAEELSRRHRFSSFSPTKCTEFNARVYVYPCIALLTRDFPAATSLG